MTMTDRQIETWVTAMGAPSIEWAANDLAAIARELDEASTRLARAHDLTAKAGDDELRAYADTAHTAAWRLADGLADVASGLTRAAEEGR